MVDVEGKWHFHDTTGSSTSEGLKYGKHPITVMTISRNAEVVLDDSCHMWCYHGTSLSTAARVFDEGFRAGPSTDHGRTGVFLIAADDDNAAHGFNGTCFDLARARAKCTLCPEWQRFEAPSLWSMPVVVMFQHPRQEIVKLKRYSNLCARKCVIPRAPGIYLPKVSSTRLLLDVGEYYAWLHLHNITTIFQNARCFSRRVLVDCNSDNLVMCGGKISDPFYWTVLTQDASCGAVCPVSKLQQNGWQHAKHQPIAGRVYRCPKCHY